MKAYDLMVRANHYLIKGGELTAGQKANLVRQLRENRITNGRKRTFDAYAYPRFYIPPYNGGKKMQTIVPMSPGTNIVADNAYEFEMLRLLHMFSPDNETTGMLDETASRLKKTCFGYQSCHYAECFEAGLTVLRFLSFARPNDEAWIGKQLNVYNNHFSDRRRHSGVQKYFWMCLTGLPPDIALPQLQKQKEQIVEQLSKNYLIKTGNEDILLYVMRNALARLPEFGYIKERKPYTNEKGRLQFCLK